MEAATLRREGRTVGLGTREARGELGGEELEKRRAGGTQLVELGEVAMVTSSAGAGLC